MSFRYFDKYNCDEVINGYLRHCFDKCEGMNDLHEVAGVLHSFVERYVQLIGTMSYGLRLCIGLGYQFTTTADPFNLMIVSVINQNQINETKAKPRTHFNAVLQYVHLFDVTYTIFPLKFIVVAYNYERTLPQSCLCVRARACV